MKIMIKKDLRKTLQDLLDNNLLESVYGNCHSTLIGFFVNWWLQNNKENHFVLEGPPQLKNTSEIFKKAVKNLIKSEAKNPRCSCDALFTEGNVVKGLLEVEGTKYAYIIKKVAEYFRQIDDFYKSLEFAIVVFYPTTLKNTFFKKQKHEMKNALKEIKELLEDKTLYLIDIKKKKDNLNLFKDLSSTYYHIKIENNIKLHEINKNNIDDKIEEIFNCDMK